MARTLAMFTDTSLCIGCRACQVACKQWNELPLEEPEWTGGYQNHAALHRQDLPARALHREAAGRTASSQWLLMSDVCKHCAQAGCLDACPTGAIYRTEFGTVNINQDVCNGCRYCVSVVPVRRGAPSTTTPGAPTSAPSATTASTTGSGRPAPRRARPSPSSSGSATSWSPKAEKRVAKLKEMGYTGAQLYGADSNGPLGGLNAFFLLLDKPSTYNLPEKPLLPQRNVLVDSLLSVGSALLVGVGAVVAFREPRRKGGRR